MNIQRYTWPVIVAAGLHGALFLMTPDPTIADEKPAKAKDLPPMPPSEKIVEITEVTGTTCEPSGGGPALPVLPDIVLDRPEKEQFTTPRTETPEVVRLHTSDVRSITPPGDGTGLPIKGISSVIGIGSLDRHPRATAQISPDYPATLHQQGIAGSVTVEFDVDTGGRVIRAEAINYTRREFAEPALRAVRNWRFEPGKRNGKVVAFRMTVPIEFKIDS